MLSTFNITFTLFTSKYYFKAHSIEHCFFNFILFEKVLLLFERNGKSPHTEKVIKAINALKEPLANEKQMWSAEKTFKYLMETTYSSENLPKVLKDFQNELSTSEKSNLLAIKALGGCLW
jgi:DNA mismatch repair protein MSH6